MNNPSFVSLCGGSEMPTRLGWMAGLHQNMGGNLKTETARLGRSSAGLARERQSPESQAEDEAYKVVAPL